MTLSRTGGIAALICAATYLFGFALLVTLLAPLGYGSNDIDPAAVVAFDAARPGILTTWNTVIYVVNALALVVLVVALAEAAGYTLSEAGVVSAGDSIVHRVRIEDGKRMTDADYFAFVNWISNAHPDRTNLSWPMPTVCTWTTSGPSALRSGRHQLCATP